MRIELTLTTPRQAKQNYRYETSAGRRLEDCGEERKTSVMKDFPGLTQALKKNACGGELIQIIGVF